MTNLDEFFSDNETQNVETLIEVTKKFFLFVSQLTEIVDSLESKYESLSNRLDQISQNAIRAPTQVSAPYTAPPPASAPVPVPIQTSTPPIAPPTTPTSLPTPPAFPSPPAPMGAQSMTPPPVTAASSPPSQQEAYSPSNLPPLPGQVPAPSQPGLSPPGPPGGQVGGAHPPGPAPRPSPMSLKAQMNMELKEAFARIRKGWDEEK